MSLWAKALLFIGVCSNFSAYGDDAVPTVQDVPVVYGEKDFKRFNDTLQQLQKFVYRRLGQDTLDRPVDALNSQEINGKLSNLYETLNSMQGQVPSLIGRMESLEHKVRDLKQVNEKLLENNRTFVQYVNHFKNSLQETKEQLETLKKKMNTVPNDTVRSETSSVVEAIPSLPPLKEGSAPESPSKEEEALIELSKPVEDESKAKEEEISPEDLYKKALAALSMAQYDEARTSFEKLLTQNIEESRVADVHFYLGEMSSVSKDHAAASDSYLKAFQALPKGERAPKSLLKLSMALHALGKKKASCSSLNKLLSEYPNADAATRSMANEKKKLFKCS